MKKGNRVLRQILYAVYEQGESFMSQKTIARACGLSLGMVNLVVTKLEKIGTVEKKPLGFRVIDPKKILVYWASKRDLSKDVIYETFSPSSVQEIEAQTPPGAIFTGYSGYKRKFGITPADYDEVYVYADPQEIKRRFQLRKSYKRNLVVLGSDPHLKHVSEGGVAPLAQIYVDLWQMGRTANRFVNELDRKLELSQVRSLEAMVQRVQKEI
jgi:hypothetical protein